MTFCNVAEDRLQEAAHLRTKVYRFCNDLICKMYSWEMFSMLEYMFVHTFQSNDAGIIQESELRRSL